MIIDDPIANPLPVAATALEGPSRSALSPSPASAMMKTSFSYDENGIL